MPELEIRCPAGVRVDPPAHGLSCRCGVIRNDNRADPLSAGVPELVSGREDTLSLLTFCAGTGQVGSVAEVMLAADEAMPFGLELPDKVCFSACPVWRAEKQRVEEHVALARLESDAPRARPRGMTAGTMADPDAAFGQGEKFLVDQAIAQERMRQATAAMGGGVDLARVADEARRQRRRGKG